MLMAPSSCPQVLCNKTLHCKEGKAAEVLELAQQLAEWSREEAKDRRKGIKAFDVMQVLGRDRQAWADVSLLLLAPDVVLDGAAS